MLGCKIFAPEMIKNKKGSIINISSASAGPPFLKLLHTQLQKLGLKNLTMNLAREWALSNVRVNALRPGFFPTDWNKKNFIDFSREESIMNHTPMKRYGEPFELIGASIWLASDASTFVTGSEVTIDGGFFFLHDNINVGNQKIKNIIDLNFFHYDFFSSYCHRGGGIKG